VMSSKPNSPMAALGVGYRKIGFRKIGREEEGKKEKIHEIFMKETNHLEKQPTDFKTHLKEIAEILEWFDSQEELDLEQGLEKVKRAGELLKSSKQRLIEIENEFKEIKKSADV